MAEVIAVSPKGKRIEMTTQGAKSHRRLMSIQGEDGWQYLNGNGQGEDSKLKITYNDLKPYLQSSGQPTGRVSEPAAKLSPTIEDVHSLLGDIFQKLTKIEAELFRRKGGRPPKQKTKLNAADN